MTNQPEIAFDVDAAELTRTLETLSSLSGSFGRQLAGAFQDAAIRGRDLEDVLRRIGLNLAGMALQKGTQPLADLGGSLFSGLFDVVRSILPFEKGGVPGRVMPFADGGVVATPTYFPTGGNIGLMGEAGAEAILPLARGADGRLGVASAGGPAPVNVVFNVSTPDAASFRKSEAQITGMIARAAVRGARTL